MESVDTIITVGAGTVCTNKTLGRDIINAICTTAVAYCQTDIGPNGSITP